MVFPTKSNLIQTKKSLTLARSGYELLDRKRNIMIGEMMSRIGEAQQLRSSIDRSFSEAYEALRKANISNGQVTVSEVAEAAPVYTDIDVRYRSVMGIELPDVSCDSKPPHGVPYSLSATNADLDDAYIIFNAIRQLTARMASQENSIYRLAHAIRQSQKRANALKNIVIPRLEDTVRYISSYLEEKEREEFVTQKVVKEQKQQNPDD